MKISEKEFNSLPHIGGESEGIVKKQGPLALKRFFDSEFYSAKKASLEIQYRLQCEFFRFPEGKLCVGNNYNGCYFTFADGLELRKYTLVNLEALMKWSENIERDLDILWKNNIGICDLHLGNAVMSDKGIIIIDTTKYYIVKDKEEAYFMNIKNLNQFFINLLSKNGINVDSSIKYGDIPEDLAQKFYYLTTIGYNRSFSLFLYQLLDELNLSTVEEYQQKVFTLK